MSTNSLAGCWAKAFRPRITSSGESHQTEKVEDEGDLVWRVIGVRGVLRSVFISWTEGRGSASAMTGRVGRRRVNARGFAI